MLTLATNQTGVITQVRRLFRGNNIKRTLADVLNEMPHLDSNQVSRALSHLYAGRWLSRESVISPLTGRTVWQYTFHTKRLPHPDRKPLFVAVDPITYYAAHPVLNKPDLLGRWESKPDPAK